jgi:carbonic anhydrase
VNIKSYVKEDYYGPLTLTGYGAHDEFLLINTGHAVQVQAPVDYEGYFMAGVEFKQFHFHALTEEIFDGLYTPLTIHMVHVDAVTGDYTVLAFLWELIHDDIEERPLETAWLDNLIDNLESIPNAGDNTTISMTSFKTIFDDLQQQQLDGYVYFLGSLTVPPCTEDVNWYVALHRLQMTDVQWRKIEELSHFNYRPIQRELVNVPAYIPKKAQSDGLSLRNASFFLLVVYLLLHWIL